MTGLWRLTVEVEDEAALPALEIALADLTVAVCATRDECGDSWRLTAYAEARPDRAAVERSLAAAGTPVPAVRISRVARRDWVAEQERTLPALDIGGFHVFGSHVREPPPAGSVPVRIDAGLAFGTGRHASTAGCLTAIDRICSRGRRPLRPLDIGTGSGILGIALARRLGVPVVATDIDPTAVRVAAANARLNGVADRFEVFVGDGIDSPDVVRRQPYDLIVANIFARQIVDLAPAIAGALDTGGRAILSGLRPEETGAVVGACRSAGLACTDRVELPGWTTLVAARQRLC